MRATNKHSASRLLAMLPAFVAGGLAGFMIASAGERRPMNDGRDDGDRPAASTIDTSRPGSAGPTLNLRRESEARITAVANATIDFSTPLSKQYAQLKAAADNGDIRAVCKLVRSFEHCIKGSQEIEMAESLLDLAANTTGDDERVNDLVSEIDQQQSKSEKVRWFCADLPVDNHVELTKRTYQAADLGDLGAMVRFSLDPPLGQLTLQNAEAAHLFRKEAPRMLERAVLAGDMKAIRSMFYAQTTGAIDTDYGTVPIERDPALLLATANVLRTFADQQVRADVEEYMGSAPPEVTNIASSSRVRQLQREIRSAAIKSDKGAASIGSITQSPARPVCG